MHLHRLVGYHLVVVILGVLSVNNAFASSSAPNRQQSKPLSPVIFVPGDGGSQMEAKLSKPEVIHYYCDKNADYFNIWLNPKLLVPLVIDCWIDNVKLIYDNKTRTTSNMPGVLTRIPGFGSSEVVEWLDPSITKSLAGAYFKDIANVLVSKGYVRNVTLRGAPYDFRKAPNENQQWFVDVKKLVEETYENGDQQRVTFIVHSMGGPMTLVFLQQQTQKWKDKYIEQLVSLAGAWAGSAKAVKVFAVGDDLGSFALSGSTLRAEQITSPSLAWLLPSPHFWKPDEVLVNTPTKQYTMANLHEFFEDINYPNGWEMRKDTMAYTDFTAPGVEVHCIYGEGSQTVERLNYKGNVNSTTPTLVTGDGDGTVNIRSLKSCESWAGQQGGKTIHSIEIPNADHMGILSDKRVVQYVLTLLTVPGLGGNIMQGKLNNKPNAGLLCYANTADFFDLWLSPFQLSSLLNCWSDNMKLSYNNRSRQTMNQPGVETRIPGWGTTDSMEYVDTTPVVQNVDNGEYYYAIVTALVNRGYERGYNIFGAPYDFRKGPNESTEWFERLRILVHTAFEYNNKGVTFIAHSMGGRMLLHFLQQQPTEWKEKYVKEIITISVPWGGSVQSLQAISVGYDFGSKVVQNIHMKEVQETCPSVVWMAPSDYFWKPNEILARTNKKNYTVTNIDEFYRDINNPNAAEIQKDLAPFNNFTAPGVRIHCLFGNNSGDSLERLEFGNDFNPSPRLVKGMGDGTVNIRSLVGCEHWRDTPAQNGKEIYSQSFPGIEHYNLLTAPTVVNYILDLLTDGETYPYYDDEKPHPKKKLMKYRIF